MKRYKIMATTIQGSTYFFCCWNMGSRYHLRLVSMQAESIFYLQNELEIVTQHLQKNLERLQIKNFIVEEITGKSYNTKIKKPSN
jgi:competence CoiA-like predicted nuclease